MRYYLSASTCAVLVQLTLLALLLLLPTTFAANTLDAFEYPKTSVLDLGALVLAAAAISAGLANLKTDRGRVGGTCRSLLQLDTLTVGVLLFGVSACLSTLLSLSPRLSLRGAWESFGGLNTIAAYVVVYLAARAFVQNHRAARGVLAGLVVAGAVAATYALIQVLRLDPINWADLSIVSDFTRPIGPLAHPNHLAEMLALACPPTLYFAWRALGQRSWLVFAVLALVQVASWLALFLSLSRAGWIALACVLGVLMIGAWRSLGRRARIAAGLAAAVVASLVMVFTLTGAWPASVQQRIAGLTNMDGRLLLWQAALDIFCRHPVCGCGLDTFQIAFCTVRTPAYWLVEPGVLPNHAHNQFLHILATQGLLGGLATLCMLVGLVLAGVRAWRKSAPADRGLVLVLLAMVCGYLVVSTFSFTLAAVGTTLAITAGILAGLGLPRAAAIPDSALARWHPRCLAAAAVLVVVVWGWNFQRASTNGGAAALVSVTAVLGLAGWACWRCLSVEGARAPVPSSTLGGSSYTGPFQALIWASVAVLAILTVAVPHQANVLSKTAQEQLGRDPAASVRLLQRAVVMDGGRDAYWSALGEALHAVARSTQDVQERRERLSEARLALEHARHLNPHSACHHRNLARVLTVMALESCAAAQDAFTEFDAALALDPCEVACYSDAANAALAVVDAARCRRYAERARSLDPTYALPYAQLGYAAMLERRFDLARLLLDKACNSDWRGQSADFLTARTNLVMVWFQLGWFETVREHAPPLLETAPHLDSVRAILEESRRRLQ
jgi:O-antigen ligase